MNKQNFSVRLNEIMKSRKLRQVDILERTKPFQKQFGVTLSKTDLSQYVNGKVEPRQDKLYLIATSLGVDPAWLMGYDLDNHSDQKRSSQSVKASSYNYFDAGLSAGALMDVDPFTDQDVETITLSDVIMGKYAGDKDIFISYINGESMNRIIPNGSLIAIKKYDDVSELCNGDIVVFQDQGEMAVKRFYNDRRNGIITFNPDSTDDKFTPINYLYANLDNVRIIGKVVVYTVTV